MFYFIKFFVFVFRGITISVVVVLFRWIKSSFFDSAWGCFDEFNRISVEVLSVVAVQVKSVQDAIRDKKTTFNFMGEIIAMVPTVGIFITMNPGYAGRTEVFTF